MIAGGRDGESTLACCPPACLPACPPDRGGRLFKPADHLALAYGASREVQECCIVSLFELLWQPL